MANNELIPFTVSGRPVGMRLAEFRNDSDEPLPSHKLWIENFFIPVMAKNPAARLRLIGMTSRNGDANYNIGLSKRRIEKVEAFIRSKGSKVAIVERNPKGELPAQEDGFADGNRSGRYRAVLLQWEGLSGPAPLPGPTPAKFKKVVIKTQPGVWLIIGVDTFGIPIKFLTAGRIVVTLLNDKGEQWAITGFGGGVGFGAELGADTAKGLIRVVRDTLKNIGLKAGDLPNIADNLSDLQLPSATAGGVFRGTNIVSSFTIQEITANKLMTVISGGLGIGIVAGEGGLIVFDRPHFIPEKAPWGVYTSLATAKAGADIGGLVYAITDIRMKGILEKEVLDI